MSHLVTTEWLESHLHDDNLRIIDIRGKVLPASQPPPHYFSHRAEYEQSHIPGAVFVDWTTDIVDPSSASYDIAPPEQYAALMIRLGVGDDTFVVAYDDAGGMFASRLWWTLRYYGHDNVAILDGGWQKWAAENRPMTSDVPTIQPVEFKPETQAAIRATADDILTRTDDTILLDVRSITEYSGEDSRAARKGRIPGAVNLSRRSLLADDMTLLPVDIVREKLAQIGVTDETENVIVYCNSGVSASFMMLAMQEAGIRRVSMYDGSWKEWGNDTSKPIES